MRSVLLSALAMGLLTGVAVAESPVATVGSQTITQAELDKHVRAKLIELEQQRYEALREGLDELIGEALFAQEAKARGITVEELKKQEITAKAGAPTEAEIQEVYEANKEDLNNAPLEAVKPQIVEYLNQFHTQQRRQAFIEELKGKYKTTVALRPPVIEVGTGGRTPRGGANAPVTIIEFSDYECPFCQRAEQEVQKILNEYGDKVRFVYRDFPLPIHAHARLASEAAHCANAQGKFWEYHAKLFANRDLTREKLQTLAGEVGLDRAKFDACLDKQEFKAAIDQDVADGASVGVTGTPTFFINGRLLSGAQPYEKLKEVIDEELARAKSPKT